MPRNAIAKLCGSWIFNFLRNCQTFPEWIHQLTFSQPLVRVIQLFCVCLLASLIGVVLCFVLASPQLQTYLEGCLGFIWNLSRHAGAPAVCRGRQEVELEGGTRERGTRELG
jgi:hypothetical protein